MELRIHEDAEEKQQLDEGKAMGEYRFLRPGILSVYEDYRRQREGLIIRKRKAKYDKDYAIGVVAFVVLFGVLTDLLSSLNYHLFVPFIFFASLLGGLLPVFFGNALLKIYSYSVMMEIFPISGVIKADKLVTFVEEEQFLDNIIKEYEAVLFKEYSEDVLDEDTLLSLRNMTIPKRCYADIKETDLKAGPKYIFIGIWVLISLLLFIN